MGNGIRRMTMITYDDFIGEARRAVATDPFMWMHDHINDESLSEHEGTADAFIASWVSGGIEGGNCWSEGGHSRITPEEEPDLDSLFDFFEKLEISFRDGRKILDLMKRGGFEERGYYGNYTSYGYKYVAFNAIYDKLVELGKAEPRIETPLP
jgi:hypothetical protein